MRRFRPFSFLFKPPKPWLVLAPLAGLALFVLLYVLAAFSYPGGSWAMPLQNGFSFWNNYLCDLLDTYAINGDINYARHLARSSLLVLCTSLMLLWYFLPLLFVKASPNKIFMQITGLSALLITLFLSSGKHDVILRIAGILAVLAFLSCFVELYKSGMYSLLLLGLLCLVVFLVNYYIYETGYGIQWLPTIQKVTFVIFITWFVFLNLALFRRIKVLQKRSHPSQGIK